jgi:thiol-disulfide isomerase/thioredoxin
MQRMLLLCLVTILFKTSISQNEKFGPLKIGDTVPALKFQRFLESSLPQVQLSNLKGKAVILDFWNVGCLACIKGMPKMDSLQKHFGQAIQIVLVTDNTAEQVANLFKRTKVKKPDLPIVVEDTMFYKNLFPHEGDPLHVWINRNGVIEAITDGHNATAGNIASLLNGQDMNLYTRPLGKELRLDNGLLEASSGPLKASVNYYSIFLGPLNEQTTVNKLMLTKDSINGKITKVSAINIPLLTLYSLAYSRDLFGFDVNVRNLRYNNRIEIQTKNPLDVRYAFADSLLDEWNKRNLVCYESQIPPSSGTSIFSIIQSDLGKYTSFIGEIEERKMACLVLKRTSQKDKVRTKNPNAEPADSYRGGCYTIVNQPLPASLLPQLVIANQHTLYPIIDETHYTGPVDMALSAKLNDLGALRRELNKYDLDLVVADRVVKTLVIRDKKHSSN